MTPRLPALLTVIALHLVLAPVAATPLDDARADLEQGKWRPAEIALKGILQADPSQVEAHRMLAELYLARGQGAAAQHEIESAIAQGMNRDALLADLAEALLLQGEARRVLAEIQPPAGAEPLIRGRILALRGYAQAATEDLEGAAATLEEARVLAPESAKPLIGLARVQAARGDADAARVLLLEALEKDPRALEAWEVMAALEIAAQDSNAAADALGQALMVAPEAMALRLRRAQLRLDLGDPAGAREDLDTLRRQGANAPLMLLLQGRLLMSEGKVAQGSEHIERYLGAAPKDPLALYLAGAAFYQQGQLERAQEYTDRLAAIVPGAPQGQALMAAILLGKGDVDGADAILGRIPEEAAIPLLDEVRLRADIAARRFDAALTRLDRRIATAADPTRDQVIRVRLLAAMEDWEGVRDASGALLAMQGLRAGRAEIRNLRIEALLRTGDTEQALAMVRQRAERNPEDATAQAALGVVLGRSGETDAARAAFGEALRLDPASRLAAINLARLEAGSGDLDAARRSLSTLAEAAPDDPTAILGLAALDLQQGRTDAAETRLREGLAADPSNATLRLSLAARLRERGDFLAALRLIQDAPPEQARTPMMLRTRGELELAADQPAQAVSTFEQLRELRPGVAAPSLLLALARAEAGQMRGVEALIEEALPSAGADPLLAQALGNVYNKQPDDAARERLLEDLERAASGLPVWHLLAADLATKREDPARAIEHLQAARALAPGSRQVYAQLLSLYPGEGRIEEAVALVRDWLADHPQDLSSRMQLASFLLRQGREPDAVAEYRVVLEQESEEPTALNNLAMLTMDTDPKGALDLARRAQALTPDDWRMVDTLALALLRNGQAGEAARVLGPARGANPGNPTLTYRMAEALAASGDRERARRLLLDIGPRPFPERAEADALMSALTAELGEIR